MDKVLGVVGEVKYTSARNDDDFVDRLHHRFTVGIMVFFAIVVSSKQFVGEPIACWVPAHFTENHEKYANSYCWVRNTYYLPFEEYIPKEHEDDKRHMIPYYQWMPIILLVQALFFYLPILIWRSLNSRSGIDVNNIVETGEKFQDCQLHDAKEKTLNYMARQMNRYLEAQKDYRTGCTVSLKHFLSRTCCLICGRRYGNFLIALYFIVKLLFIANVIGQIFLLNAFLNTKFHMYGFNVLEALFKGEDWTMSSSFPRVTMCDLKVRRLGNVQRYTVQCVLPINLFNEKIYLFLWFWMVFLAALSCLNFLQWILKTLRRDRHRYVKKHLQLMNQIDVHEPEERKLFTQYVDKYLLQDGAFVMRLVGHNTNAITVTEFDCKLWEEFKKRRKQPDTESIEDSDPSEGN